MQRCVVLFVLASTCASPAIALYDPRPDAWLFALQGEWRGSLAYRDYSDPNRLVTLPTRLFVSLSAPSEMVLHYVFADGPGKTVYSYERMNFDAAGGQVTWSTGNGGKPLAHRITADTTNESVRTIVFERQEESGLKRHTLEASARKLRLSEDEVTTAGVAMFRNRYEFSRVET